MRSCIEYACYALCLAVSVYLVNGCHSYNNNNIVISFSVRMIVSY